MSPRDRRAMLVGGVLIGVAVAYRLVLSPVVDRWGEARQSIAAQSSLVAQFEEKLEKRDDIRGRLEKRFGPGVNQPLKSIDEAQVAFPRSVQQAIERGGGQATQVEVQGSRRVRDLSGVEMLSLRVQVNCEPDAIPKMFAELAKAEMPVVVESVNLSMPQRGQRQQWRATLVVSTPTLAGSKKS